MANDNLTGQTIASTYNQLLITADTGGITGSGASATQIHCGGATAGAGNADTTALYLSTTRVGIGTTSPAAELDISSTGTASLHLTRRDDAILDNEAIGDINFVVVHADESTERNTAAVIKAVASENHDTNDFGTDLVFMASDNQTSSLSNIMVLQGEGKRVGIGTTSPEYTLHVKSTSADSHVLIESTESGSTSAPDIQFLRNPGEAGANNDYLGILQFAGYDAASDKLSFGDIYCLISDATNGAEDGYMSMRTLVNGSMHNSLNIRAGLVGIGETSPTVPLHIVAADTDTVNSASAGHIMLTDDGGTDFWKMRLSATASGVLHFDYNASGTFYTAMSLQRDGNVGIGTTAPDNLLHIKEALNNSASWDANYDSGLQIENTSTVTNSYSQIHFRSATADGSIRLLYQGSGNDGDLAFLIDDAEAMRITNDKYVGIGTTVPSNLLHIEWSDDQNPGTGKGLLFTNSEGSIADGQLLGTIGFDSTDGNVPSNNLHASAYIAAYAAETHGTSDKGGDLAFGTAPINQDDDTASTERMRILSSGNVGIGTASPQIELHVDSAAQATATAITYSVASGTIGDTNTLGLLNFGGKDDNHSLANGYNAASIQCDADSAWDGGNRGTKLRFNTTDGTTTNTKMTIRKDGNVGIGTTAPNALLEIDQGAADDAIMKFVSSDVAHGMTDIVETDVYASFVKAQAASGGLMIRGWKDADGVAGAALSLNGNLGEAADTTKSTSAEGIVEVNATIKSSATVGAAGSDGNLMVIQNNATTRFIFDAEGTMHGDEAAATFSDSRLKTNIEAIPYGLSELLQLEPKRFDKQSGSFDDSGNVVLEDNKRKRIGFIAQEVKAIIPEVVKDVDETESFYSLNDGSLMAVLVKAVQELTAKVEALESK